MSVAFRKLHRRIAPILFLPLLATALTGVAYRLGRSWFGIPSSVADFFLVIHQGEYLGMPLVPIYVLLVGVGLIGLIVTGLTMIKRPGNRPQNQTKLTLQKSHQILAPIVFLPLLVSAVTGIAYRLGKAWFGMSNQQAATFLRIHQGTYLGSFFRVIYVFLLGLGLVAMLFTGIKMTGIFPRRRQV